MAAPIQLCAPFFTECACMSGAHVQRKGMPLRRESQFNATNGVTFALSVLTSGPPKQFSSPAVFMSIVKKSYGRRR